MTSTKQHKKSDPCGDGAVGSSYALHLLTKELHKSLELSKFHNYKKAVGDALDLSHALAFTSPKKKSTLLNTLTVQTLTLLLSLQVLLKTR